MPYIIFSILFASSKPVLLDELTNKLNVPAADISAAIIELEEIIKDLPLRLSITENSLILVTKPEYASYIGQFRAAQSQKLSDAAMETLAYIILNQPVTKPELDEGRGVDCEKTLATLKLGGLIKEICRMDSAGSPALYWITEECLHRFGVKSYIELQQMIRKHL